MLWAGASYWQSCPAPLRQPAPSTYFLLCPAGQCSSQIKRIMNSFCFGQDLQGVLFDDAMHPQKCLPWPQSLSKLIGRSCSRRSRWLPAGSYAREAHLIEAVLDRCVNAHLLLQLIQVLLPGAGAGEIQDLATLIHLNQGKNGISGRHHLLYLSARMLLEAHFQELNNPRMLLFSPRRMGAVTAQ